MKMLVLTKLLSTVCIVFCGTFFTEAYSATPDKCDNTRNNETAKCQEFNEKALAIIEKFNNRIKSTAGEKNADKWLKKLAPIYYETSRDLLYLISQSDIPADLRDAALEFTQAMSDIGRLCAHAPHIPQGFCDAALTGIRKGAEGDMFGGNRELSKWRERLRAASENFEKKQENLNIVFIKHGIKFH